MHFLHHMIPHRRREGTARDALLPWSQITGRIAVTHGYGTRTRMLRLVLPGQAFRQHHGPAVRPIPTQPARLAPLLPVPLLQMRKLYDVT